MNVNLVLTINIIFNFVKNATFHVIDAQIIALIHVYHVILQLITVIYMMKISALLYQDIINQTKLKPLLAQLIASIVTPSTIAISAFLHLSWTIPTISTPLSYAAFPVLTHAKTAFKMEDALLVMLLTTGYSTPPHSAVNQYRVTLMLELLWLQNAE